MACDFLRESTLLIRPKASRGLPRLSSRKVLEQRSGVQIDGEWRVRHPKEMPEDADRIESPTRWRPATPPSGL
jgi:hypothetical protein